MKSTLGMMILATIALMLVLSNVAEACLANNEGCQPDGSKGICCSGYCYKQHNWSIGVCANRKKRAACVGNGMRCRTFGSRERCCSGSCVQHNGGSWGICQ